MHQFFPFDLVDRIGVYSQQVKATVEKLLDEHELQVPVSVEDEWYYS